MDSVYDIMKVDSMKIISLICAGFIGGAISCAAAAAIAHPLHPVFEPEAIGDFAAALQKQHGRSLDSRHSGSGRYHAYRFLDPDNVVIGVARDVIVDGNGQIVIEQEPGAPLGGQPNRTHREFSHILGPVS